MTAQSKPPVLYLPNFIAGQEATVLFDKLVASIPWEQKTITFYGKVRPVPRLTCWFGDVAYSYSGIVNLPQAWTADLDSLRTAAETVSGASFNSCLANLYRCGNDSVGWHADDEVELGPRPTIASVSLGAVRTFRLRHVASGATYDYELASGSLLVMHGSCQADWVHCVPKRARVAEPRINLTFRRFLT